MSQAKLARFTRKELADILNRDLDLWDLDLAVAQKLYEGIDTPRSLTCYLLLKYKEYDQLVNLEINPACYITSQAYFLDKQATSFLMKYDKFTLSVKPEDVARQNFLECEASCAQTNSLWKEYRYGKSHPIVDSIILSARRKIAHILGEFDVQEWVDSCRFGPGSVIGVSGTSDISKLSEDPTVTPDFEELTKVLLQEYPSWVQSLTYGGVASYKIKVVPGGKYSQVPKTAKTNRNIEVQPLMNGFAQLGLGQMIRRRLKVAGIDLDDQSRNQELARIGSIDGSLATIDLSNASDTISREVVLSLLPEDWYHALDLVRTRRIDFEGELRPLERFCSMGNGFAFELETLLFYAISLTACETKLKNRVRISVYGDDIIVPSEVYSDVADYLSVCGFTVNKKKSFSSGVFRESCGADWFFGRSVRPFFLKKGSTDVASLISLANGLRRAACRSNCNLGYDRRFAAAWYHILRRIPVQVRRRIAFGYSENDDIILSGRVKDGQTILFRMDRIRTTQWYPSLAAALYRNWMRYRDSKTTDWSPPPSSASRGEIFDFRRNQGKWGLGKRATLMESPVLHLWW